jgi:hypothetical protein
MGLSTSRAHGGAWHRASRCRLLLVLLLSLPRSAAAAEPIGTTPPAAGGDIGQPRVEERGHGRYRIGAIKIHRDRHRFAVRGVILRDAPPLEFLAVTAGGEKAYESLVEVSATAHDFNLACILIGLNPDNGRPPRQHFDPEPAQGDPIDVRVSWIRDGTRIEVDAADLIQAGEKTLPRAEWVYTGSRILPDGRYLAALSGTAIGFVHHPATIIEHRSGFLGQFNLVSVNKRIAPVRGTRVTVTVLQRQQERRPPAAARTG